MLGIVLATIFAILIAISLVIIVKTRRDETEEYYDAARNILKSDRLDSLLKKNGPDVTVPYDASVKPMVYLKVKGSKTQKYVFDPSKTVNIGRDKALNQICIDEAVVSHFHCRIYSNAMNVYLQNVGALNGVQLKRGRKVYTLGAEEVTELYAKDIIIAGTTRIEVTVFYFDLLMM